jgi:hypothetical protein
LREPVEHTGVWWLPEQPQHVVSGTLYFDPSEGIDLKLVGTFGSLPDLNQDHRPDIILGATTSGKLVTLHHNVRTGFRLVMPGVPSASYRSAVAFFGHHFAASEQLRFRTLSLAYPHLAEWTGLSGFSITHSVDEAEHWIGATLAYSFPDALPAAIPGAELKLDYESSQDGDLRTSVLLNQRTFFKVTVSEPTDFSTLWSQYRHPIENFLTFAVGTPVRPTEAFLTADGVTHPSRSGPHPKKIEVLKPSRAADIADKPRHRSDMLFTLEDIGNSFGPALTTWMTKAQHLEPVYNLYFGLRYATRLYLENQLLAVAQALEVLHRRTVGGQMLPDPEFALLQQRLSDALPDTLDGELREAFQLKLRYFNEVGLRRRIRDLLSGLESATEVAIPHSGRFVDRLVTARNFLTHFDRSLEQRAPTGEGLYLVVRQAMFLLELRLMLELDMATDLVERIARRNERYLQLGHWARRLETT